MNVAHDADRAHRRPRPEGSSERGLVLVMFALVLTVLLVVAAMAVDLGRARFSKRDEQSATDLAALDAGFYLAGKANPGVSEPAKACKAAVESAQRNVSELASITAATISTRCGVFPSTAATCVAASPVDAKFTTADYVLTIRYPVPEAELDTSRFSGGGALDGANGCKRMRVTLAKTENTTFARVIGINSLNTRASAVVRAVTPATAHQAPALVILERTGCDTLGTSAGGSGSEGIIVEHNGSDPGIIHSDSDATTGCSGTSQGGYAVYAGPLPSGAPAIKAESVPGPDGRAGIIQSRATNGRGGATFPGGLNRPVTLGGIISRKAVDERFNTTSNPAITSLHATARARITAVGAPAGHTTMGCADPLPAMATRVYVDCAEFNRTLSFAGVTEVVFRGDINIKNSNVVTFPHATSVVVRGKLDVPQGRAIFPLVRDLFIGNGLKVDSGSGIAVNNTTESDCNGRQPPAVWTNTTRVAVFDSPMDISGSGAFCQTTVYLAGPRSAASYAIQQVTAGGTCTSALPCPLTSGNTVGASARAVFGSGTTHWSAPNQHPAGAPPSPGLEDLALWTEGNGLIEIKSGASVLVTGIFFGPNSDYELRSPATGISLDAQFWARRLFLYQGTLRLRPAKANTVTTPLAGGYSLIR